MARKVIVSRHTVERFLFFVVAFPMWVFYAEHSTPAFSIHGLCILAMTITGTLVALVVIPLVLRLSLAIIGQFNEKSKD